MSEQKVRVYIFYLLTLLVIIFLLVNERVKPYKIKLGNSNNWQLYPVKILNFDMKGKPSKTNAVLYCLYRSRHKTGEDVISSKI